MRAPLVSGQSVTGAIAVALLAGLPAAVRAQEVTLKIQGQPGAFWVGDSTTNPVVPIPKSRQLELTFDCPAAIDCSKIELNTSKKGVLIKKPDPSAAKVTYSLPGGPTPATFAASVRFGGAASKNLLLFQSEGSEGGPSARVTDGDDGDKPTLKDQVAEWLVTPCEPPPSWASGYLVTPFGRVLFQPRGRRSDDDSIRVSVLADKRLTHLLTPKEGSELAVPTVTNIYGRDVAPFKITAAGEPVAPPPACAETEPTSLGPFAAPKGVVKIMVATGTEQSEVGSFQFPVHEMYTGTFAVGGVGTTVASPTFEKAFNGTDTVVTRHGSGRRLLYTLTYTHFLWGRRDLTRPAPSLREHFNPLVGVVLNDIANNGLIGVSVELRPGITFAYGQHVAKVKTLDPSSGAAVDRPFQNRAASVPTDERWTSKPFYGVTVDVHAAAGLLKSLLGDSSGQ